MSPQRQPHKYMGVCAYLRVSASAGTHTALCAVTQNSCLSQSHMFPITTINQLTYTHKCTTHGRGSALAFAQKCMMGD